VPPWQLELTGKVALCLGGEEKGLRARTRGLCDALVGLPMRGRVESLNVATAASALLYDAVRQRQG
jgi:23S rRNA (guanosine2251-2'-O)-methyltransferase